MKKFIAIDLILDKLLYLTPPHAPVLVSTISPFKNFNIGCFEQFMTCSNNPPRVLFSITQNSDTYKNISDGSDFCVGIPTLSIIKKVYKCGEKIPRSHSEFDRSGLTPCDSFKIQSPQIFECSVNLECRLFDVLDVGDHALIIGNVVYALMDEKVFSKNKTERRLNINAPYYATSGFFFKMGEIIEVKN